MAYDEDLADRTRDAVVDRLGDDVTVTERRMFGGLAFLVRGNMAIGVSGQGGLMVRVDPVGADDLLAEPGAAPMVMRGRPMTGWLLIAAEAVTEDAALARWVSRGVDYARQLPPK